MKSGLYKKLAWEGIKKNKKMYLPYILTCTGTVMMYYIISFLSVTKALDGMVGVRTISNILTLASQIVALFSVFFLFYSNSFLTKQRKKEMGLYNILGMNKYNISKIMLLEAVIVFVISMFAGLFLGITLSKLFELGLLNLIQGEINFRFLVFPDKIAKTAVIYLVIHLLIFFNNVRQIVFVHPIELVQSESAGERPPKANWLFGFLGAAILAVAYYIAATMESMIMAFSLFFVAVVLVVIATYLIFISGSVVCCRLLQRNKKYYYKANHFVSVSSMTYRMKRNGAGLASICLMLTSVLVMLCSSAALYFGIEDMAKSRYPKDINISIRSENEKAVRQETQDVFRNEIRMVLEKNGVSPKKIMDYQVVSAWGVLEGEGFGIEETTVYNANYTQMQNAVNLQVISLKDYNRTMGTNETLKEGEILIFPYRTKYTSDSFQMNGKKVYHIKKVVDHWEADGVAAMDILPTVYVFTDDRNAFINEGQKEEERKLYYSCCWRYAFDLEASAKKQIAIYESLQKTVWREKTDMQKYANSIQLEGRESERDSYYSLYGGLFYVGILLSMVLLAASVLIIYYKQISEGYEDWKRFEIMRNVGITTKEIKRSINSQMLTVFFMPLILAGLHLAFAFPLVEKILEALNMENDVLFARTTVGCFFVFGALYLMIYKITSNAYYSIVSGKENK